MVTTYDELIDQQAQAAARVMGAHHSSWNHKVALLAVDDSRRGKVDWDHTIAYHPSVLDDLREMFDTAGQQHAPETLARYREALRVVLHENVHLLAARGTSHAMGYDAYQQPHNEVVEEGTTELATQQELNEYIKELRLEAIAPGISTAKPRTTYNEYVPAIASFAEEVGEEIGQPTKEIVRRLASVNAEDKLPVAAGLLYDSKVGALAPVQAKDAAVKAIVETMQPAFAEIHGYNPEDPQDVAMSKLAGMSAAHEAVGKADELREFWAENQDLRRSLDAGLDPSARPGQSHRKTRGTEAGERDGRRPETGAGRAARPQRGLSD